MKDRRWIRGCILLLVALCIAACGTRVRDDTRVPAAPNVQSTDLVQILSGGSTLTGWSADGEVALYDEDTLFDLVNGQADAFFAYNFRRVAVQSFTNDEGDLLRIELWELATPEDAYGLFTRNVAGAPPAVRVGNDADADPGLRLAFWQDRYFVQVRARQPVADGRIEAVAEAIAGALPKGGGRPALMAALPAQDRTGDHAIFFRNEISIQDEVWLGGENILGLGPDTAGVLGRYEIAGTPAVLLLAQYPTAAEATAALQRLHDHEVADLAAADTQGTVLTALFGALDRDPAQAWLDALPAPEP